MTSRVYRGYVVHARKEPVENVFEYPIFTYAFDLDQLTTLSTRLPWFSRNRFNIVSIHDKDYLGWGNESLRTKVECILKSREIYERPTKIMLVTSPKILGYVFNPVSFYYCYNESGKAFAYIAEINNTFEERTIYVFKASDNQQKFEVEKNFHVSPFYDISGTYHVSFGELEKSLDIKFNLHRGNEKPFIARMYGEGVELETCSHRMLVIKYFSRILMIMPRIYFQAIKLVFVKRLKVFQKPNPEGPMSTVRANPCSWFDMFCMSVVKRFLKRIAIGQVKVVYPDGRTEYYGDASSDRIAEIRLHNYKIFFKVMKGGGIGVGESYTDGDWSTSDLTEFIKLFLDNEHALSEAMLNIFKPFRIFNWILHKFRNNSKKNSKKNISEHYDIGNSMFSQFLDETMVYSSALFEGQEMDLKDAQLNKIRMILEKSRIRPGQKILEIGCGWGELAAIAAKDFKASVTGITLSKEQAQYATEKAVKRDVSEHVQIQIKDYRDVQGQFDRIVSVEMLEAVGREYLGDFFKTIDRLLTPHGVVVLQVIAYSDPHYQDYLWRQDWIQKHIFPGSHLPSLTAICEAMSKNSNLIIDHVDNYAADYALTLAEWRRRFNLNSQKLKKLGYDDRFQRAWNFYLSGCEAEFATRWISLYQIVLTRPNNSDFEVGVGRAKSSGKHRSSESYIH